MPQGSNKCQSDIQNGDSNTTLLGCYWINSFNNSLLSRFLKQTMRLSAIETTEKQNADLASKGVYDEEGKKPCAEVNIILTTE